MKKVSLLWLPTAAALTFIAASAAAQPAQPPALPVRYDQDLLPSDFHAGRRQAVLEQLPADAVAVVLNNPVRNREGDVEFEFRVASDLYYLTGTHESGSALVLVPRGVAMDGAVVREILFVPPKTPFSSEWEDRLFGVDGAAQALGIFAVDNDRFEEILEPLLSNPELRLLHTLYPSGAATGSDVERQLRFLRAHVEPLEVGGSEMAGMLVRGMLGTTSQEQFESRRARHQRFADRYAFEELLEGIALDIYTAFSASADFDEWATWRIDNIDGRFSDESTLTGILSELRARKEPEELFLLQRAIDITTEAHLEAIRSIEPGMHEYEIEAVIEFVFKRNGAEYPAFPSIVASGENSVILHYQSNRRQMQRQDMVVMDIGAEYHGYAADVTRTVPVDGVFSDEQRAVYEIVLQAYEAAVAAARPGVSMLVPHTAAQEAIAAGLLNLGIMSDPESVRDFFPHGTSHYLGLWTHDVGDYGILQPGNVITIEPGIYIRPDSEVDAKYWNVGIRIEDDVLITEDGNRVLSAAAPRSVEDIEALMAETGLGNERAGRLGMAGAATEHPAGPDHGDRSP
jgi:Xaa-Pro aminopeptidase